MLQLQPPGRLRIPLQQRRDHGRMVLIILPPLGLGQAALLQAVPMGLVARGIDCLAIVDQQRVLGGAEDREMQRRVPMLELRRALGGDALAQDGLDFLRGRRWWPGGRRGRRPAAP